VLIVYLILYTFPLPFVLRRCDKRYCLASWSRVLLAKLLASLLVKEFLSFMEVDSDRLEPWRIYSKCCCTHKLAMYWSGTGMWRHWGLKR